MSYPPPLLPYPPPDSYSSNGYDRRDDGRPRSEDDGYGADKRYRRDDRFREEYGPVERHAAHQWDGRERERDREREWDRHRRRSRSRSPRRDGFEYRSHRHERERHHQRYEQPPPPAHYTSQPPPPPPPHSHHDQHSYLRIYPRPQPPPQLSAQSHLEPAPASNGVLRIGFAARQSSNNTNDHPPPAQLQPLKLSLPLPPPPPPPLPAPAPPASYRNPPITDALHSPPRCAFVWLVMKGDAYVPGALVSAFSVSLTRTPHSLVCMVTSDVSNTARSRLSLVFHRVVEVDYIVAQAKPLRTAKQQALYSSWSDRSFTKWQCLSLTEYDRVLFIDADKLVLANIDHLFLLPTPAATFSSPWSTAYLSPQQKQKRGAGLDNPYVALQHGDVVPHDAIERGFHSNSFVCIGTMVLLRPCAEHLAEFVRLLAPFQPSPSVEAPASFGYERCHSMLDEQSLTLLYHQRLSTPFTYIHQRYNYLCWHRDWLQPDDLPFVFHYFSTKPWHMSRREWLDVDTWWRVAEAMLQRQPEGGQREEARRALGDGKQLEEERLAGCAWCKECKREGWEAHSLFDDSGAVECPEMRNRQPRDGAERLQPASEQAAGG